MVEITQDYSFDGPAGRVGLLDLFEGRGQLLVYHFMLGPDAEAGCPACSFTMDYVGPLEHLHARDTSFAAVSRADFATLRRYRERMGWTSRGTRRWVARSTTTFTSRSMPRWPP
jgi:predicted dithiol-disulfide oxidoreductase (DUF899 family)